MKSILMRNPNAFDSKFKSVRKYATHPFLFFFKKEREKASILLHKTSDILQSQIGVVPIAHKVGCRCRKSMCLKKYCECFQVSPTNNNCSFRHCHKLPRVLCRAAQPAHVSIAKILSALLRLLHCPGKSTCTFTDLAWFLFIPALFVCLFILVLLLCFSPLLSHLLSFRLLFLSFVVNRVAWTQV